MNSEIKLEVGKTYLRRQDGLKPTTITSISRDGERFYGNKADCYLSNGTCLEKDSRLDLVAEVTP